MNRIRSIFVMVLLVLTVSFSGCVEKSQSQTNIVEIKNLAYQPSTITVPAGATITWMNKDPMDHTVTATDGSFNSGNIASGGKYNLTFSKEGKYQYQCLIHVSMVGEVVVTAKQSGSAQAVDQTAAGQMKNIANQSAANKQNSSQQSAPMVGLKLIAQGLSAPMEFISANDGSGQMFAVDQIGKIMIVTANGKMLQDPFLDIQNRLVKLSPSYDERGLLGLAFHPDFARNGRIFVYYSAPLRPEAPAGWSCTNQLSEFRISKDDPNKVDMSSEQVLLQVDKPQSNHNGGTIAFGPDGYLYIPLGDGGGANDVGVGHAPEGNGQNTSTLLGKILRIDVDNKSAGAYGIPMDNPFVGMPGYQPEIWAYGLRNPWRISFDKDGRLFVSDAGQNLWEEVDIVAKGGNYGWNIKEGTHCFDPKNPNNSPASCPDKGLHDEPLIGPVIEYDHTNKTVVVGGYIYQGQALPDLEGCYIFADWSSSFAKGDGTLLLAQPSDQTLWRTEEIKIAGASGRVGAYIRSLGRDEKGELYLLTSENAGPKGNTGKIFQLISST